jgi:holin-like protein
MLGSLTLILACQLVGEIITTLAKLPIPGPVIGMVILFFVLAFCPKKMPRELEVVGGFLLRFLALLFVPAGVGIITNLDMLSKFWAPITGVIIIGTVVTIAVTGIVMQFMNRRYTAARKESRQ